jgi:putative flippase GtrA
MMKIDVRSLWRPSQIRRLLRDPEWRRFILFLFVGGINTLVGYSFFVALSFIGLSETPAVVLATCFGIAFNFMSTGKIVFGSGRLGLLPKFVGVYVIQCAANLLLLHSLIWLGVNLYVAEAAVLFVLAIGTFFAMRRFVFTTATAAAVSPGR